MDLFAHLPVRPKLHVATPSHAGTVVTELEAAILHLAGACANQGIEFTRSVLVGTSILPMARNKLTDMFLCTEDTHLLFVDADIIFDPKDVLIMLASGHKLVGLPCSRRVLDWKQLARLAASDPERFGEHPDELLELCSVPNFEWMPGVERIEVTGNFADVGHVGTGCLLIAREVLEKLGEESPTVHTHVQAKPDKTIKCIWDNYLDTEHNLYVGEDVRFCQRARALGYQPKVLVSAKTRHVGTFEYRCNVLAELRDQITEWCDPFAVDDGGAEAKMSIARYEWVRANLMGKRVAHAASGCNWAHTYLTGHEVVAFDRCPKAAAKAVERGFPPVMLVDIEAQMFDGFDSVVCVETLEHLRKPWAWVANLAPSVTELLITTPMVPTKHCHSHHLHDWTAEEVIEGLAKLGWTQGATEHLPDPKTGIPAYVMVRVTR